MEIIEEAKALIEHVTLSKLENEVKSLLSKNEEIAQNQGYSSNEYIDSLREYNKKNELLSSVNLLDSKIKEFTETNKLLHEPSLSELAKDDLDRLTKEILELIKKIKLLTVKPLDGDVNKALFEIRPGVGGVEASLFAEDLFKIYTRYCSLKGYKFEAYSLDFNSEGGINEAVFIVDEPESFAKFRFESGVHRVQRVPSTEAAGRIHTSTASVVVMPKFENVQVQINPNDLRIDVYRSSGPGGQSVNTTDSAVRITHLPSGLTVTCQNSRYQNKNKEMAMSILMSRLYEIEKAKKDSSATKLRQEAIQGGDRSAKIRTYNFPQGRITDHRIGQSWFNIEAVMAGEIEEIITTVNQKLREEINSEK